MFLLISYFFYILQEVVVYERNTKYTNYQEENNYNYYFNTDKN